MELAVCQKETITNPNVGDLLLGDDGDEVVLTVLGLEVAQRLFVRLNFFQGEWQRDLSAGTPYYQQLLRKAPSDRIIRAIFTQVILGAEGVQSLSSFGYTLSRTRELSLVFTAVLEDGSVFRSTSYGPFHVTLS
jgi:hypothetical protein